MDTIPFLRQHFTGTGFENLATDEIDAIRDFTLLWSAFEGNLLGANANRLTLTALAAGLEAKGSLKTDPFRVPADYFRARYWENGTETLHVAHLNIRPGERAKIYAFIDGSEQNPVEILAGLFLVIYRLRNNLFHGPKWAYGIQDQRRNFTIANQVLMTALQLAK
ncbi:MAG: hypothetical protein AMXMBFR59_31380 [Rhodanobacteraceae bacterium]